MQSKLLRELSSERTPRNTFGHRHEPHRFPLREISNAVKDGLQAHLSFVLVLVLVLRPRDPVPQSRTRTITPPTRTHEKAC